MCNGSHLIRGLLTGAGDCNASQYTKDARNRETVLQLCLYMVDDLEQAWLQYAKKLHDKMWQGSDTSRLPSQ